jgi:RNA polymerase sigma-70 factor, ECF subfamily
MVKTGQQILLDNRAGHLSSQGSPPHKGWKLWPRSRMLDAQNSSNVDRWTRDPGFAAIVMSEVSPRTAEQSESALVTAAKAGNYDAFEQLVNRYEHKIYRLGLNITGNPEDAEDVLQEAFLKAFENLPRFREDSRFYTWIVRIAVNQALMKLRKRRTDRSVSLDDPIEEDGEVIPRDFADWKPNPEQLLGRTETREVLEKAIQDLPPSFRTVFTLRDVEGLSTEETAEMLGLTISAVKARLFRARLRLREELSKVFKRG